jgi:hypothetical protein
MATFQGWEIAILLDYGSGSRYLPAAADRRKQLPPFIFDQVKY